MTRVVLALALLPAVWSGAYAQNMAAAAAASVAPVQVAPVPMGLTPSPGQALSSSLGSPTLLKPSLTPSLPAPAVNPAVSLQAAPSLTAVTPAAQAVAKPVQAAVAAPVQAALPGQAPVAARPVAGLPAMPGHGPAAAALSAQSAQGQSKQAAGLSLRERLAETSKGLQPEQGKRAAGLSTMQSVLSRMFDGLAGRRAGAVAADYRPPDWSEDRAINKAIARLSQSPIGADIYKYVYENHKDLRILVDDDKSATYDARLVRSSGKPVLYLTKNLVRKQSAEVVAAYMAREMSDLYFDSFPLSAERGYMAYSNMARVYAELTGSGFANKGYWWDTLHDQWTGDAYAMQRYYGSWKEAVTTANQGGDVRTTPFFRFLQGRDDSSTDPQSKLTLRDLYNRGRITWQQYRDMSAYFDQLMGSERDWFGQSGRW